MVIFAGTRCGQKHSENEDHLGIWELENNRVFVAVADGMGSHAYGGSVARLVVEELGKIVGNALTLEATLKQVHLQLRNEFDDVPELLASGAAISLLMITPATAEVCWAGDSPVYHTHSGGDDAFSRRVTTPHVESSGLLTNWFSCDRDLAPERIEFQLQPGDIVTVCTDGVVIDEATHASEVARQGLSQQYIDDVIDASVSLFDSDDATMVCYQHG